jgi:hypothetical protein
MGSTTCVRVVDIMQRSRIRRDLTTATPEYYLPETGCRIRRAPGADLNGDILSIEGYRIRTQVDQSADLSGLPPGLASI